MNSLLVEQKLKKQLELSKIRIKTEIDEYLKANPQQSRNGIAQLINVRKDTIYSWYYGKFKTSLKKENISKLAKLLKINPLYLLGESNCRIEGNDNIDLKSLIGENALLGLRKLQDNIDEYNDVLSNYFIFDDINYIGIVGEVIGDVTFWRTLIHEAQRLMQLQTIENTQNEYELLLNKNNMDTSIDNPTKIDYLDIVHQVNAKAINTVFDRYIEKHRKDEEKFFEERVSSPILRIQDKEKAQQDLFEKNLFDEANKF